jgi:putative transposase
LYYALLPEKPEYLKMMSLMDAQLTSHPTEGVLSMVDFQQERGYQVGPKRVSGMFKLMGHETIYRWKNLINVALRAYIKPYLLRGLKIDRANQVWCTDITYIPTARGFMYITAYIDVYSRRIMSWGISNSMSKQWCMDVLEAAIAENGVPEIINCY